MGCVLAMLLRLAEPRFVCAASFRSAPPERSSRNFRCQAERRLLRCWAICPLVSRCDCTMLPRKMSSAAKQSFLAARLPGFTGRGDKYLGELAQELRRVLWKTQNKFAHATCRLPDSAWSDVAVLL